MDEQSNVRNDRKGVISCVGAMGAGMSDVRPPFLDEYTNDTGHDR